MSAASKQYPTRPIQGGNKLGFTPPASEASRHINSIVEHRQQCLMPVVVTVNDLFDEMVKAQQAQS